MYIIFVILNFSICNSMEINVVTQVSTIFYSATKLRIRCEYIYSRGQY